MGIKGLNQALLDTAEETEVVLEVLGFSGGENQISPDHLTQNNECRTNENWEPTSVGALKRVSGIDQIATAGSGVSDAESFLGHHHYNETSASERILGVIDTDLVEKSGSALAVSTGGTAAFTADKVCTAVDGGDAAWITNGTDNLKRYTIAAGLATPAQQPASAHDGIYKSKQRLLAVGNSRTIEYSRTGTGNWTAADAWTASNDAATTDLPGFATGALPGFPSSGVDAVFNKDSCYAVFGVPNVAYDEIPNSMGCHDLRTLARAEDGAFGFTLFPKKMVWFWNRTQFIDLTDNVDWIDNVSTTNRMWAAYRDGKYYFFYNDSTSGVSTVNRLKIFDKKFGGWRSRIFNASDNLGAPLVLKRTTGDIYAFSSSNYNLYQLDVGTEDEGSDTEATYVTKRFTSRDFLSQSSGKPVSLDEVCIKLTKILVQYNGQVGSINIAWGSDFGAVSDSISIDLAASGTGLGSFTLGTDTLAAGAADAVKCISLSNKALGKRFDLTISNNGQSTRPEIKKIRLYGILYHEG